MKRHAHALFFLILFSPLTGAQVRDPDDRTQFARNMIIEPGEEVGDALCFFCSIHVRGTVSIDAVTIGGGIEVQGTVEGDAVAAGGGIRLGPGAKVDGDAVAVGGRLDRDPKSSIGGDAVSNPWLYVPGQRQPSLSGVLLFSAASIVVILIATLIARERRAEGMANTLRARPALSLLAGVGVFVAAIILFFFSNHMGRAQPLLATFIFLGLLITAAAGYHGLCYALARRLAGERSPRFKVLLGAVLIVLLELLPVLGFFAFLGFVLLAMGCAALSRFGSAAERLPHFAASPPVPPHTSPPSA